MDSDDQLLGHWSSLPLSYGVMEASELGFLPDGWGWSAWFDVGGMSVTRFRWGCPAPGVLELREQWTVQGTPGPGAGPSTFASTEPPRQADGVTRHPYAFGLAVPYPGAEGIPAVLFTDEPVEFCHEFARGPIGIRREDDPSHLVLPYA
ncbi:hypothetical protein [Streptomyces sp. Da 82-17]|uniref:hypothetical protein n=1 Tax=Streptomyces sp. Da 82-17 TaxID=3377116 RepID=UPI0038D3E7FF